MDDEAGILLVHTRLAIVGLGPEGSQPHKSGTSVLVYNGEIYNHARVAADLRIKTPSCDTQTVHEVLRRSGAAGLGSLDGMFALAWWEPDNRRLLIARDHWGVKPLYIQRHKGGGVTVASELSVLALTRPPIDPAGLASYVAFGYTTSSATVYEKIAKLPAGSHLELVQSGTTWRSTAGRIPLLGASDSDISQLVGTSVRDQLMSDAPLGLFLSGGVDSTLIAAAAASAGATPHCFTLSFPETPSLDESSRAARNAARLGLQHSCVPATAGMLAVRAGPLMASAGEPVADPASLAVDLVSERASEHVKVVLTGEGADELFGGYGRHRLSRRLGVARVRFLRSLLKGPAGLAERTRGDAPWQRAATAVLTGGGAMGYAVLQQAELSVLDMRPDLLDSLRVELRTDWQLAEEDGGIGRAALLFDQRRWLPNTYLEKIDRATMRHGLEGRVPFLSTELTVWAARSKVTGKDHLIRELHALLPSVELPDRKKGLAIELGGLMRSGLNIHLDRVLMAKHSLLREVFGESTVRRMAERASRSPTFAYRLATVGVWEEAIGIDV